MSIHSKASLKLIFIVLLSLGTISLNAQASKTDYFMKSSVFRTDVNPAFMPEQGFIIVPVLPGINANLQSNTINMKSLTSPGPNGKRVTFIHQSVDANEFLSRFKNKNYIAADVSVKLFSFGFFKGENYWNVSLNVKANVDANIPKSFFELIKTGFNNDEQVPYDLKNLNATGLAFAELGVAHSRSITNDLTIGVRPKLILGLADFDLHAKSLELNAGPKSWSAKSHVRLKGSAPGVTAKYNKYDNFDGFRFGNFNIPGYGMGIDVGGNLELRAISPILDRFKLSASVNDIGVIFWSKNNSIDLTSPETEVIITPSDYSMHATDDGLSISDVLEDAFEDIKKAVNLKGEKNKARTSSLSAKMNLGLEYAILDDNKLSAGFLYSARFGQYITVSETTVILNYNPLSWLSASGSYSFIHGLRENFGAAIHIKPKRGINLFLSSDYLIPHVSSDFLPTKSKGINLQLGISIPLGQRHN